jgi:PEGA domain
MDPGGVRRISGRMDLRGLAAWSLALVVTLSGARALASDDASEAERLIRQGLELRHDKKEELALPYFQKAYELVRTPRTEGQLGLVEMALGYWVNAEQHLAEALKATEHSWVAKNHKALQDALTRIQTNIGELVVVGAPEGATILINGRASGAGPVRVGKGKVELEVRANGFHPSTSTIEVQGGQRQRVTVALEKEEAPPPAETPAPLRLAIPAAPRDNNSNGVGEPVVTRGGRVRRGLAWGTGIGAGVVLAGAVAEAVIWQLRRHDFETHVGPPAGDPTLPPSMWKQSCGTLDVGYGGAGCKSLYDEARSAETLALIGFAAGGALAITSSVLFLTSRNHSTETQSKNESKNGRQMACAPAVFTRGFSCGLTF